MDNETAMGIKSHLEFLGFTVTDESDDGKCQLSAKSTGKPTLEILIGDDNVFFIFARYHGFNGSHFDKVEFHQLFHKLNKQSTFSKWVAVKNEAQDDIVVVITTWSVGYDKIHFGRLINNYLANIHQNMLEFAIYAKTT